MLLTHWARRAASRAACTAGSNRAISTAMIAMTTRSSISVKPRRSRLMVGKLLHKRSDLEWAEFEGRIVSCSHKKTQIKFSCKLRVERMNLGVGAGSCLWSLGRTAQTGLQVWYRGEEVCSTSYDLLEQSSLHQVQQVVIRRLSGHVMARLVRGD